MKSMTGFGRGSAVENEFAVTIELKTVNNRFLDVNLRLPYELQSLEGELKRIIGNRISRGRIDVNLQFERNEEVVYEINRPLVAGYLSALRQMQEEFSLAGEPDMNVIARLPNVLQTKKEDISEEIQQGIARTLETALDELEKMREIEGASLKNELNSLLTEIENQLPIIEGRAENVFEEYRLRLSKKVEEMLTKSDAQIEIDEARLAQEVAYLATRSDISEEIARLKSHLEQFRQIMDEEKEIGKRLDFLTQELNREANTISSKSGDIIVKESALTIKAGIEKIREQVQNVE